MLKLYGITQSRAFRPRWLLEELGLDYEQVPLDFHGDDLDSAAYRALNPNGRIPTLVDGDLVLWESMAINLYLAKRYGVDAGLWPDDIRGEALALQWSFWVMTEVEHALLTVLMHGRVLPPEERDAERLGRNRDALAKPLGVLDGALHGRDFLAANRFTVADLNVAAVLSWCKPARVALDEFPRLGAWLAGCLARPARKRAQGLSR
ncbi:MAG: glutathione S-transferase family protein [Gammaproteobacteria bacterium]|nr:glutathione S-transferase family protein [Gammaproteobacteria bacterium]